MYVPVGSISPCCEPAVDGSTADIQRSPQTVIFFVICRMRFGIAFLRFLRDGDCLRGNLAGCVSFADGSSVADSTSLEEDAIEDDSFHEDEPLKRWEVIEEDSLHDDDPLKGSPWLAQRVQSADGPFSLASGTSLEEEAIEEDSSHNDDPLKGSSHAENP